jgi:hypothetical protein
LLNQFHLYGAELSLKLICTHQLLTKGAGSEHSRSFWCHINIYCCQAEHLYRAREGELVEILKQLEQIKIEVKFGY